jgi:hypothetical protein
MERNEEEEKNPQAPNQQLPKGLSTGCEEESKGEERIPVGVPVNDYKEFPVLGEKPNEMNEKEELLFFQLKDMGFPEASIRRVIQFTTNLDQATDLIFSLENSESAVPAESYGPPTKEEAESISKPPTPFNYKMVDTVFLT